jgi:hypothetical protein
MPPADPFIPDRRRKCAPTIGKTATPSVFNDPQPCRERRAAGHLVEGPLRCGATLYRKVLPAKCLRFTETTRTRNPTIWVRMWVHMRVSMSIVLDKVSRPIVQAANGVLVLRCGLGRPRRKRRVGNPSSRENSCRVEIAPFRRLRWNAPGLALGWGIEIDGPGGF